MISKKVTLFIVLVVSFVSAGCTLSIPTDVMDASSGTQLQKRSYQSRSFETGNKEKIIRSVVATLQDMGYTISQSDMSIGTVSAYTGNVKMTISVRPRSETRTVVRASATRDYNPITDSKWYQNFFVMLSKSLYLEANEVD